MRKDVRIFTMNFIISIVMVFAIMVTDCKKSESGKEKQLDETIRNIFNDSIVQNITAKEPKTESAFSETSFSEFVSGLDWILPKIDTRNEKVDDFNTLYSTSFYENKPRSENYRYYDATVVCDMLLYSNDNSESTIIKKLLVNTALTLIAQNNSNDDRYFLVKLNDEKYLWSGWVKEKSIDSNLTKEIDAYYRGKKFLNLVLANVSMRNDIFADHTGWRGEFIIAKIPVKYYAEFLIQK